MLIIYRCHGAYVTYFTIMVGIVICHTFQQYDTLYRGIRVGLSQVVAPDASLWYLSLLDEVVDHGPVDVSIQMTSSYFYIDGLVQERRNPSALAIELRLPCTNPLIYFLFLSSWIVFEQIFIYSSQSDFDNHNSRKFFLIHGLAYNEPRHYKTWANPFIKFINDLNYSII